MRILLDEDLPVQLRHLFPGHEVRTVQYMGWNGLANGELLAMAKGEFDVLVTGDSGIPFQQNISEEDVAVVVLVADSNTRSELEAPVPHVLDVLPTLNRGDVVRISAD